MCGTELEGERMTRSGWAAEAAKSAAFGCTLFFSAVFVLLVDQDMEHLALFSDKLVFIMGGYILAVMLIRLVAALPFIRRLEDLDHRPRNEDEFMEQVENYCKRSGLAYEIIQYGMPAQVRLDEVRYFVKVSEYCSMASGIVPALEFTVMQGRAV